MWLNQEGLVWLAPIAALPGILKALFVLDRAAAKGVARIRERGDGRCIGGFLSVKSWLLVLVMMAGGRLLRAGYLPKTLIGFLYVAIGVALVFGSRRPWVAWRHFEPLPGNSP